MEFAGDCIISPNNCDESMPVNPVPDPKILQEKSQTGFI